MSTVKTTEANVYKINGRTHYFARIDAVRKISASTFEADRNGATYRIEGGKAAGGARDDWFVDGGGFEGTIRATGLIDALKMLNGM